MTTTMMPTELYEWGSPTKEYTTNRWYYVALTLGALLFGAFLLIALLSVFEGNDDWGAVGVTGAFVLLFIIAILRIQQRVAVFDKGFVYHKGKHNQIVTWDDIETVKQYSVSVRIILFISIKSQGITIWTKDGRKIKLLDQIGKVGELITTIQKEVTARQLPVAMESFLRGEDVVFDKNVKVNKQGITWRKKTLAWDEYEELRLLGGSMTIRKKGKRWGGFASTPVGNMPNIFVFIGLVEQIAKEQLWMR